MALKCVCFPVSPVHDKRRIDACVTKKPQTRYCKDQPPKVEIDICKILERSQDETKKHNDYDCHYKGEDRQNLINKIKMFLDDYDDRPVMRGKTKHSSGSAKGETGFGPMIRYPGYVDYGHPYFSDPYNKMPTLALTAGPRPHGQNLCPPISVRNWDATQRMEGATGQGGDAGRGGRRGSDGGCHCAKKRGDEPKCPAARDSHPRLQRSNAKRWSEDQDDASCMMCVCEPAPVQRARTSGGFKYYCYPLPDVC